MSLVLRLQVLLAVCCLATGRPEAVVAASVLLVWTALRTVARHHLVGSVAAGHGSLATAQWRELLDRAGQPRRTTASRHRDAGQPRPAAGGVVQPVAAAVQGGQR